MTQKQLVGLQRKVEKNSEPTNSVDPRYYEMSFKKPVSPQRKRMAKNHPEVRKESPSDILIEKRLKSSGKKAREEIFEYQDSDSSKMSKSSAI